MRTAFIEELMRVAAADERVWLLTGDLGFSVLEPFAKAFSDRYVNVGVAEQNMTGLAAGLAMAGRVVFTYSIANFATLRCLEQVRNDVCAHHLPVKVVAVGGGMSYGSQGYTHHGIEDLPILRALPGMAVLAPGDPLEARLAVRAAMAWPGPAYLRLGKAGEPVLHAQEPASFEPGVPLRVRAGDGRAAILSTGGMLQTALRAAELLGARGVAVSVLSCPWVKPMHAPTLRELARTHTALITVEEGQRSGGLGGVVAEVVAAMESPRARVIRLGLDDLCLHEALSQQAARDRHGLGVADLARAVEEALAGGQQR